MSGDSTTQQFHLYIMSGGAGTRLWPLSRETQPKQFYDLTNSGRPLIVDTAFRLRDFGAIKVVTTEALKFATMGLLKRFGIDGKLVGEPEAKNTAAAVALATRISLWENEKSVVGVFPADHIIQNTKNFSAALSLALQEAHRGEIVTLGIRPTYPSIAYGYMELDGALPEATKGAQSIKVSRFIEKPDTEKAQALLKTGRVVWNAGIFIFPAARMAKLFENLMPELWKELDALKKDLSNLKEVYAKLPSQSIDYGIMEKTQGLLCVAGGDMGWSDVGSWEEVSKLSTTLGKPIEVDSSNNFYTGVIPEQKRVAFVGVKDLVVIDTPDALLVTQKGAGQQVKKVVDILKSEKSSLTKSHEAEERPWGRFEVLVDSENFKSKKILVWPGQRLSYQSHNKRAEHWVIVKGEAQVTLNDVEHNLKAGDHIFIPLKAKHRISNLATETLEFVEVQTGSYFGEDDITRYQDDYGRH